MRTKLIFIVVLMFVALSLGAQTIDWLHNIEDALQIAKKSNKHVFVFFTGSDWCSWCDKLDSEVFKEKAFQEYVNKNMVMVMLDFPRSEILSAEQKKYNNAQQQKYNIQGYPSVIVLNTEGEVALQTGYREGGAYKYVEFLKGSLTWKLDASNATWKDEQGLIWQKNFELAQELANKENKAIFINFTGSDWCVWCHRLDDEVFSQPEFVEFANNNLVLVRFDFPKQTKLPAGEENYNMKMAQKYGVKGFPTLFLTDSSGNIIQKLGYEKGGAVPYTEMLRDLLK
jgi:thioredoxin-related protein